MLRAVTAKLALYHYDACGYCARVREAIEQLGLEVEMRDVLEEPSWRRELAKVRGRGTVPVLRIEDEEGVRWMGESADIVRWLWRTYRDREPPRLSLTTVHRGLTLAMWALFATGFFWFELRSWLFASALAMGVPRSLLSAYRTRSPLHAIVAALFAFGSTAVVLQAANVVVIPWWWAVYAFVGALLVLMLAWRIRRARASRAR
ncbi:MAG: glutathione S-transferase N-terminal domain-containing protein [Sandaracinus sp.]|nr:glutathione S-transferase N-terminal domain-containing protein [Sandaracinus sp.]